MSDKIKVYQKPMPFASRNRVNWQWLLTWSSLAIQVTSSYPSGELRRPLQ